VFKRANVFKQQIPFVRFKLQAVNQGINSGVIKARRPAHTDTPLRAKPAEQVDSSSVFRPVNYRLFVVIRSGKTESV